MPRRVHSLLWQIFLLIVKISFISCSQEDLDITKHHTTIRLDSVVFKNAYVRHLVYEYNAKGLLTREIEYPDSDTIIHSYTYDQNGDLKTIVTDYPIGQVFFYFRNDGRYWYQERYEKGNLIYTWKYADIRLGSDTAWINENGRVKMHVKFWNHGNVDSIQYFETNQDSTLQLKKTHKMFYGPGLNPYFAMPLEWKYLGAGDLWGYNSVNALDSVQEKMPDYTRTYNNIYGDDGLLLERSYTSLKEFYYYSRKDIKQ